MRSDRPDASMTLVREVMERPLDPGYAAASARRRAAGLPQSTGTRTVLVAVAAVVVGFLLAVAAQTLRPVDTVPGRGKGQLVEQVQSRDAAADAQAARVAQLEEKVRAARAALSAGSGRQALEDELAALERATGVASVSGPGLRVQLDDAPDAQAAAPAAPRDARQNAAGRVTAGDLQVVVNGLWQSGAEAVAVNGQRLTVRSAISMAGAALLVDFRPVSPPYQLLAVGDPNRMSPALAAGPAGSYLKSLADNYRIRYSIAPVDSQTLPGSASALPRATPTAAGPAGGPAVAPAPTSGLPTGPAVSATGTAVSATGSSPRPTTPPTTRPSEKAS